jgi:hemolysin activation/secretion protein
MLYQIRVDARLVFILLILFCAVIPREASAQIPSSTEPGIVMRGIGEEERPATRLDDTIVVPKQEEGGKGLSTEKVFVLKSVVLDGSSVYQGDDIAPLVKDMIGQPVSFFDLNVIAQRVTRKYREDGYIFSRAILPPQKISGGELHLQAVEGRIAHVEVTGNFRDRNGLIKRFADKIRSSAAANTREIERYLLLINDLPGISAKSFVRPSQVQGGGDLIINVEEDYFEGSASIDNRGSRFLGPWRGTLVGAANNLFGLHDRTTLRAILTSQTEELRFADITHEEQIGAEGFKVKARAAVTRTEPGGSISPLGIEGDSDLFDLEGVYPFLRGRRYNLNFVAGFNALNSESDLLGIQVGKDHVRSVRAGANVDFVDPLKGVNQIDAVVTRGLDVFGATEDGVGRSRANGEHEFLRGNLTATRVQQLWDLWSLMLSGTAQASDDPLLASEEFQVGGPGYGRAYDAGEITGDSGWAGLAELRYGGPVDSRFLNSYQLYSYVDYGRTRNKSPVVGETAEDSLTSAGIGIRFNLIQDTSGYIEIDKPINKPVASEGDDDSRLFFSLLKRF